MLTARAFRRTAHDLGSILDRDLKPRLAWGAALSALLAGLEALALVLIYPLMLTLGSPGVKAIPDKASWLADLLRISDPSRFTLVVAAIAIGFFIVKSAASVAYLRWSFHVLTLAEASARSDLFRRYLAAPFVFHLAHNSSEIHRTLNYSLQRVYREALAYGMTAVADALVLLFVAVVLAVLQPVTAAVAISYFAAIALVYQKSLHGRTNRASAALHAGLAESHQLVQQSLGSIKEVIVLGRERHFGDRVEAVERELAGAQATVMLVTNLPRYYLELSLILGIAVMSAVAFALYDTSEALAVLGLFLAAGFRSLPSLNRLLVAISFVKVSLPSVTQVAADVAELEASDRSVVPSPRSSADQPAPQIELEQVTYRYPHSSQPAVEDVTIRIAGGEMIGIVGASGAGKSTLTDLLLGLLAPSSGQILIDGETVHPGTFTSIGYVPQHVGLLDDTLAANIAFGTAADPTRLEQPSNELSCPMSLPTFRRVSTRSSARMGSVLSGGQRQRVGIRACALWRPDVARLGRSNIGTGLGD